MATTTANGTALAITAGIPATHDIAGFGALAWTDIGSVESIGAFGPAYAKAEFQPLRGAKQKLKGSVDYGTLQLSIAHDDADAGQSIMRTGSDNNLLYGFRVTYPDGAVRYFRGRVFGYPESVAGADTVITAAPTIEISTRVLKDGAVAPTPTPTPGPTPGPIQIILVDGDSNARASANDETAGAYADDANVLTWAGEVNATTGVYTTGALVPYRPVTGRTGCVVRNVTAGSETKIGPEIGMIQRIRAANPSAVIGVLKVAKAGSYESYDPSNASGATAPGPTADLSWDVTNGVLHAYAKAALIDMDAKLKATGWTPSYVAVIDVLGQNDSQNLTLAANIRPNKLARWADLISAVPALASAMFLVQRIVGSSTVAQLAAGRAAQQDAANWRPWAVLVDTDGASVNSGDPGHYNTAGLVTVGQRHYAAMTSRMNRRLLALGAKSLIHVDANTPDTIVSASGLVGSVTDQSSRLVYSQADSTKQPALATLAGAAAFDFDGANDGLDRSAATGLSTTADCEGYAIVDNDTPAATTSSTTLYARGGGTSPDDIRVQRTVTSGVSRYRLNVGVGGGLNYAVADTNADANAAGADVIHWRIVGSNLYINVNNMGEVTALMPNNSRLALSDTQHRIGSAVNSQWFDGRVRMIGETSTLTAAERTALIADLMVEAGR